MESISTGNRQKLNFFFLYTPKKNTACNIGNCCTTPLKTKKEKICLHYSRFKRPFFCCERKKSKKWEGVFWLKMTFFIQIVFVLKMAWRKIPFFKTLIIFELFSKHIGVAKSGAKVLNSRFVLPKALAISSKFHLSRRYC